MAAKTLNDFTLAGTAASDDFVVGFDTAVANGERKWTVATIANAVSGVMTPQLNNAFFNSTDVIPIAKGGTERTTGFAGLTALAGTVLPTINTYLKVNGSNNGLTYDVIDLNSGDVTGVLPIAKGGTGGSTGGSATAKAWVNFDGINALYTSGNTVTYVANSPSAGQTTVTVDRTATWSPLPVVGDWVTISGVTGATAVNGTFQITEVDNVAFNIKYIVPSVVTGAVAGTAAAYIAAIRSSYNVSSVTKSGVGDYKVNFITSIADTKYCVICNCQLQTGIANYSDQAVTTGYSTSGVDINTGYFLTVNNPRDQEFIHVAIFGN